MLRNRHKPYAKRWHTLEMTENQIKFGVWHVKEGFVPPSTDVTRIEDFIPSAKLSLLLTQTSLKPHIQKKNYERWCEILPEAKELKFLWLPSKVNQKIFDAVCRIPNLEGLWIEWSSVKNIDNLVKLSNLRHLHLGASSQVENIEALASLSNLETLATEQLNKISDFSPIAGLRQLQGLGLDGGMYISQKINTLEPIGGLENLKYLTLTNSQIKDKSLDPLLKLNELMRLNCSLNYPASEFDKLKSMPNLKYGNVVNSWK